MRTRSARRQWLIGLTVFVAASLLFALIATHIASDNWMVSTDRAISHWFELNGPHHWRKWMRLLAELHSATGTLLLFAALILLMAYLRDWMWCALVAVVGYGGLPINVALKSLFERHRPEFVSPLVHLKSFSFPSNHTFGATLFYGMLALWLISRVRSTTARAGLLAAAFALTLLVAVSRVFLGAHWPSDTIGAMSGAIAWMALCVTVANGTSVRYAMDAISSK